LPRTGALVGTALLGTALVGARPAFAEEPDFGKSLRELEVRYGEQLNTLSQISDTATSRSGFLSAAEAQRRYEDAVFSALMGDNERAALEFHILINSGAAASQTVRTDAEWYLAETLFGLGNYATAEDAYRDIVNQGQQHTFFSGAVRRLLELYGLTGDSDKFYQLYDRYITTRLVAANELINYTVARSLYRQGDWVQAKTLFSECCEGGEYNARAHYFIGTILVLQEDLEAAAHEFSLVSQASVESAETREVVDLANLAYGRVQYELGNYSEATAAYNKVGRDSRYFADQLYELVWTFIKQDDFESAISAVEIFLLAFPEHRYAAQLKVIRGHLHMKQERYENANAAYEKVVTEYSPIRDLVAAVSVSHEQPRLFFERLAQEDALERLDQEGLPPFAAEMLYSRSDVNAVVELRQELDGQRRELDASRDIAEELDAALSAGINSLGAFKNAYETMKWLQVDQTHLMSDLLGLEEEFLIAGTRGSTQREIQTLRQERVLVSDVAADDQRSDMHAVERNAALLEQVRAVQSQAFLVEQVARDLLAQAEATEDYLEAGQHRLDDDAVRSVRKELLQVKDELNEAAQQLGPLQTEAMVRRVMGSRQQQEVAAAPVDEQVLRSFEDLRRKLGTYRARVAVAGAHDFFSRVDILWADMERMQDRTVQVTQLLGEVEQEEIARITKEFGTEFAALQELERGVSKVYQETDVLGIDATRSGFEELTQFFNESVMKADLGIVDVYWMRKVEVSKRIGALNKERQELEDELKRRFEAIDAKLED